MPPSPMCSKMLIVETAFRSCNFGATLSKTRMWRRETTRKPRQATAPREHISRGKDASRRPSQSRISVMSRGFGKLQRALVSALERDSKLDTHSLAKLAYAETSGDCGEQELTESQLVSVRRSLQLLAEAGLVFDLGRRKEDRRREWAGERHGLPMMIRRLQRKISESHDHAEVERMSDLLRRYRERAKVLGLDVQGARAAGGVDDRA